MIKSPEPAPPRRRGLTPWAWAGVTLGVVILLTLTISYLRPVDMPREAAEDHMDERYDEIAEQVTSVALGSLPPGKEIVAELAETMARRVLMPYRCPDAPAGTRVVRCTMSAGIREPVRIELESLVDIRLDPEHRNRLGRREPVAIDSEVVSSEFHVDLGELELGEDLERIADEFREWAADAQQMMGETGSGYDGLIAALEGAMAEMWKEQGMDAEKRPNEPWSGRGR